MLPKAVLPDALPLYAGLKAGTPQVCEDPRSRTPAETCSCNLNSQATSQKKLGGWAVNT